MEIDTPVLCAIPLLLPPQQEAPIPRRIRLLPNLNPFRSPSIPPTTAKDLGPDLLPSYENPARITFLKKEMRLP